MTKNEIIRELSKNDPSRIKCLAIIYHNRTADIKYVFSYEYTTHASHELLRELARVVLSLWRLRRFVVSIVVEYFPFDDDDYGKDYGKCVFRSFQTSQYVLSVSDFIQSIKK